MTYGCEGGATLYGDVDRASDKWTIHVLQYGQAEVGVITIARAWF